MAFEPLNLDRMEALLAAVNMDDELKRALISVLSWINFSTIAEPARRLLSADLAFLKYLGLGIHAVHRREPGPVLRQLLEATYPMVQARAAAV